MVPYSQWDSPEEEGRYTWQPQPAQPSAPVASGPPWTAANPPPAGSAPPGTNWMLNPTTGEFEPVQNGQLPPWGPRVDQPGSPPPPVNNPPPPVNPPPTPPGPIDTEWGYLTEPYRGTAPSWQSPNLLAPPRIQAPPPFKFREFAAPTPDSIYADPSYKFRFNEGQRAVEQGAASKGILRTGGTMKDLTNYGQNAASQEYSNIFGRAVDSHNLGLNQELGTYGVNWGVGRDVLDRELDVWGAQNAAIQSDNQFMNQREFDNFLQDFSIFDRNKKRVSDALFGAAGYGD